MNSKLTKTAAVLAFIIGAMAILAGGQVVLLGKIMDYYVIDWLPVYNLIVGIISALFTAIVIWKGSRIAMPAAIATLISHSTVMVILQAAYQDVVAPDSIKDIGGFMKKSPWKRELVTVAGRKLTLNNIENDIIRPDFGDARIHFALNCASIGCPPLSDEAYAADRLSEQLDAACRVALNRDQWVQVDENKLKLTKIFDWYGGDFEKDGGSVLDFVRRYRTETIPEGNLEIDFMSYDWSLNIIAE